MKYFFLILFIPLNGVCQNTSQSGFTFPETFVLDVYNYSLKQLRVKQVVQYSKSSSAFFADTARNNKIHYNLQYVLDYDSLHRPKKFKYDFHINNGRILTSYLSQVSIIAQIDSGHVFTFIINDSASTFNYFEYKFNYQLNNLISVEVFNPSSFRGAIDGVYLEKSTNRNTKTINEIDSSGNLIQSKFYEEDELIQKQKYKYNYKRRK